MQWHPLKNLKGMVVDMLHKDLAIDDDFPYLVNASK